MMTLRAIARALGGEVSGAQVLAPGPGHGPQGLTRQDFGEAVHEFPPAAARVPGPPKVFPVYLGGALAQAIGFDSGQGKGLDLFHGRAF